jgi:hypothetical protein
MNRTADGSTGSSSVVMRRTTRTVVMATAAASRSANACSSTPSASACTLERNVQASVNATNRPVATHSPHQIRRSLDGLGRRSTGSRRAACSNSAATEPGTTRFTPGTTRPMTTWRSERDGA